MDQSAARRFRRNRSGNVAMLWALLGGVLAALVGLTVDFARAQALRSQLQNAADGAALVAERSSSLPLADREARARAFFDATLGDQPILGEITFNVFQLDSGGHRVEATATFDNGLSLLAGMFNNVELDNWDVAVASEAEAKASPPIEVALVLDNTGSMSSDMQALRDAAEDLATDLLRLDGDSVHVAVVPFVAQVNIGNATSHLEWMDTTGVAPYNGEILEDRQIGRVNWSGSMGANCENLNTLPYTGYPGPYRIVWVRQGSTCRAFTPEGINHFTLFNLMPTTQWKGCVEARPAPYDILDTPPSISNPATLFVPFFWVDTGGTAGQGSSSTTSAMNYQSSNSYLTDSRGNITSTASVVMTNGNSSSPTADERRRANWFNVFKWRNDTGSNVSIDDTPPDTRGPNRGCPTPIVPLTTDETSVVSAIQAMRHWNGAGGTNQMEGMAWGWRVLSPGAPFTEGRDYGEEDVRKVIVHMSDGQNTNVGTDSVLQSDYSSLNHLGLWDDWQDGSLLQSLYGLINSLVGGVLHGLLPEEYRRDIDSSGEFVDYINDRQRELCENIKDEDIEIYTVIFRETDEETVDLMRDCATSESHFYRADNAAELASAFAAIGSGIGQLRITR